MSKLTPQNKWLLAILAVILINGAVWYFGLSPALDKVEAVKNEYSQAQQKKTSLELRLGQLNEIDASALELEMEALNLQLPELGLLREFLMYLEATTEELNIELSSIPALTQNEVAPYLCMNIRVAFTGGYQETFDFIQTLEQHERLLLVKTFNLAGSGESLTSTIDFVIYAEDFDQYTPYEAPGRDNPFEES